MSQHRFVNKETFKWLSKGCQPVLARSITFKGKKGGSFLDSVIVSLNYIIFYKEKLSFLHFLIVPRSSK